MLSTIVGAQLSIGEQTELGEYELIIERGLQTFVDVGNALMAIRDGRLYRQTHKTFEEYCEQRWQMEVSSAYRYIRAAEVVKNVDRDPHLPTPTSIRHATPLAPLTPDQQRAAWQEAVETAPNGKITGSHVASVVERYQSADELVPEPIAYVPLEEVEAISLPDESQALDTRVELYDESLQLSDIEADMPNRAYKNSSESNEWYTPRYLIDKACAVMGAIDLDPASSVSANERLGASRFYTIQDNALVQDWSGRVWLNPPYGNEVEPFVDKLIDSAESGEVTEALLLVAARTDTAWFRKLRKYPRCFLWGRVRFINGATGESGDPAGFPSMAVYIGPNFLTFADEFKTIGDIYLWWNE